LKYFVKKYIEFKLSYLNKVFKNKNKNKKINQ